MPWQRMYVPTIEQRNAITAAADPAVKRPDMAEFYRNVIYADHLARRRGEPGVDFGAVNAAILERWSPSGLNWIKSRAWKLAGRM